MCLNAMLAVTPHGTVAAAAGASQLPLMSVMCTAAGSCSLVCGR